MVDAGKSFGTATRETSRRAAKERKPTVSWPTTGTLELIRRTPPPDAYRKWVSVHLGPLVMPFSTLLAGKKYARTHGTIENPAIVRGGWPTKTLFTYPEKKS